MTKGLKNKGKYGHRQHREENSLNFETLRTAQSREENKAASSQGKPEISGQPGVSMRQGYSKS